MEQRHHGGEAGATGDEIGGAVDRIDERDLAAGGRVTAVEIPRGQCRREQEVVHRHGAAPTGAVLLGRAEEVLRAPVEVEDVVPCVGHEDRVGVRRGAQVAAGRLAVARESRRVRAAVPSSFP